LQNFNKSSRKPYFVIRCVTESNKGFGNLNRCLIISKLLSKKFQIVFVIEKNYLAKQLIIKNGFICKELPPNFDSIIYLENLHKKMHFVILLLDVRELGEFFAQKLQNKNFKLIQFDDAWCKNIFADFYFNGLPQKTKKSFVKKNTNTKIYVGSKFWISDNNFYLSKKSIRSIINKNHYIITISFGGSDPQNLTMLVLNAIISLQNITINVIVGPFFNNIKSIDNFQKKNNITVIKNNFSLWKIFKNSDIVICSAGNTVFDLILQRVPTICIPIVDHQNQYSKFLHSNNLSINLGPPSKLSHSKIRKFLNLILEDSIKRKELVRTGMSYFDGKGTSRVISKIVQSTKIKN
jgi:spore coat polysaccharide biosynthesis predicted glycosyltransferase SpsG